MITCKNITYKKLLILTILLVPLLFSCQDQGTKQQEQVQESPDPSKISEEAPYYDLNKIPQLRIEVFNLPTSTILYEISLFDYPNKEKGEDYTQDFEEVLASFLASENIPGQSIEAIFPVNISLGNYHLSFDPWIDPADDTFYVRILEDGKGWAEERFYTRKKDDPEVQALLQYFEASLARHGLTKDDLFKDLLDY